MANSCLQLTLRAVDEFTECVQSYSKDTKHWHLSAVLTFNKLFSVSIVNLEHGPQVLEAQRVSFHIHIVSNGHAFITKTNNTENLLMGFK